MSVYTFILIAAGAVILYDFVTNLIRLFSESKKLTAAGKTPLTGRNLLVVTLAAIAETIVIFLITLLFSRLRIPASYLNVFLMSVSTCLAKNVGSYLTAWGMWATFVRVDKKKAVQKVNRKEKQEKEEALK